MVATLLVRRLSMSYKYENIIKLRKAFLPKDPFDSYFTWMEPPSHLMLRKSYIFYDLILLGTVFENC